MVTYGKGGNAWVGKNRRKGLRLIGLVDETKKQGVFRLGSISIHEEGLLVLTVSMVRAFV
jgi:hypothetical protein